MFKLQTTKEIIHDIIKTLKIEIDKIKLYHILDYR